MRILLLGLAIISSFSAVAQTAIIQITIDQPTSYTLIMPDGKFEAFFKTEKIEGKITCEDRLLQHGLGVVEYSFGEGEHIFKSEFTAFCHPLFRAIRNASQESPVSFETILGGDVQSIKLKK